MEENQNEIEKSTSAQGFFFKKEWLVSLTREMGRDSYVVSELCQAIIETGCGFTILWQNPDGKLKDTTPLMCCLEEHSSEVPTKAKKLLKKIDAAIRHPMSEELRAIYEAKIKQQRNEFYK